MRRLTFPFPEGAITDDTVSKIRAALEALIAQRGDSSERQGLIGGR
jgi:hypothetical protein